MIVSKQLKLIFQKKMNLLIRMSDGGIKRIFAFDEIKSFQAITASKAQEMDTIQLEDIPSLVEHSKFECPISMDNEADPANLINISEKIIKSGRFSPLLVGFDKTQTENIISCPYNALHKKNFHGKIY